MYEGYAEATNVNAVGLDETVPIGWAARCIQRGAARCVQGNLDPQVLAAAGSQLVLETARILGTLGAGPFIFNLGTWCRF